MKFTICVICFEFPGAAIFSMKSFPSALNFVYYVFDRCLKPKISSHYLTVLILTKCCDTLPTNAIRLNKITSIIFCVGCTLYVDTQRSSSFVGLPPIQYLVRVCVHYFSSLSSTRLCRVRLGLVRRGSDILIGHTYLLHNRFITHQH